jgi:hypothetical protein
MQYGIGRTMQGLSQSLFRWRWLTCCGVLVCLLLSACAKRPPPRPTAPPPSRSGSEFGEGDLSDAGGRVRGNLEDGPQSGRELFKSTSFPWVSNPNDCQRSVMAKSCHYVVRKQTNAGSKTDVSISWLSIAESCTDIRAEFALMYGHPYLYKCNRTLRSLHP